MSFFPAVRGISTNVALKWAAGPRVTFRPVAVQGMVTAKQWNTVAELLSKQLHNIHEREPCLVGKRPTFFLCNRDTGQH